MRGNSHIAPLRTSKTLELHMLPRWDETVESPLFNDAQKASIEKSPMFAAINASRLMKSPPYDRAIDSEII